MVSPPLLIQSHSPSTPSSPGHSSRSTSLSFASPSGTRSAAAVSESDSTSAIRRSASSSAAPRYPSSSIGQSSSSIGQSYATTPAFASAVSPYDPTHSSSSSARINLLNSMSEIAEENHGHGHGPDSDMSYAAANDMHTPTTRMSTDDVRLRSISIMSKDDENCHFPRHKRSSCRFLRPSSNFSFPREQEEEEPCLATGFFLQNPGEIFRPISQSSSSSNNSLDLHDHHGKKKRLSSECNWYNQGYEEEDKEEFEHYDNEVDMEVENFKRGNASRFYTNEKENIFSDDCDVEMETPSSMIPFRPRYLRAGILKEFKNRGSDSNTDSSPSALFDEVEEEEAAAAAAAGDTFTVTTSPTTTRTRHSPPPPPIYIHARPQSYCTQLKKRRVSVDDMGYNNDDKDYDYRSTRENLSFHAPTPVYASTSHGEQMYARNISNAFDSWSATSSSTPSLANVNSMTSTTAMTFRTPPRMNLSKQNDEGQRRQVQVKDQQQKTPKKQEDDTLCESPELMDIILHTSVESYIQGPPPLRRRETNYLF